MDSYINQNKVTKENKVTKVLFVIFLSTMIVIFTELFYSQFIKSKACDITFKSKVCDVTFTSCIDKKSKEEEKECEEKRNYENTKRDMYDLIIGITYLISGFFLTKNNEAIGYSLMVAGIVMDSRYSYNAYIHNNKQLLLITSAINIGICIYIAKNFF